MAPSSTHRYGCPQKLRHRRLIMPATTPRRRLSARALAVALPASGLLVAGASFLPATWSTASAAASQAKVVIVVGPVGKTPANYVGLGNAAAAAARRHTSNVTTIYSPGATWTAVSSALQGANVVVYIGHGNGWPNPYSSTLNATTQDGMGLNATSGGGNANLAYVGESQIGSQVHLAPNAVVLLTRLCYASGDSEWGKGKPTLAVAKQRVDNFAAGFIRAGARAVIADALGDISWYVETLFTSHTTIDSLFRAAPDAHGNYVSFASGRSGGFTALMDVGTYSYVPDGDPYYRSMVSIPSLSTDAAVGLAGALAGRVTFDRVNLRSSPSLDGRILAKLSAETPFTVSDDLVVGPNGRTWAPVRLGSGATGWIASEYAVYAGSVVTTAPLRLRKAPSTGGGVAAVLRADTRVTLTASATDESGRTWFDVKLASGATGWVASWFTTP